MSLEKYMQKISISFCAFSAIACNVAMKILSTKYGRLSLRYSRAFHYDVYRKCTIWIISDQIQTVI